MCFQQKNPRSDARGVEGGSFQTGTGSITALSQKVALVAAVQTRSAAGRRRTCRFYEWGATAEERMLFQSWVLTHAPKVCQPIDG